MSKGKYSPTIYATLSGRTDCGPFTYNAKGEIPPATWEEGKYDTEVHFGNYDKDGFDSYGYSAYDADGKYVGIGDGVDRTGYTEMEYLCMSDDQFEAHC